MTLKKDRPDDPNSGVNIDVNLIDRSTTIAERDEAFGGADEIGLRRSWFGL